MNFITRIAGAAAAAVFVLGAAVSASGAVDFVKQVKPILESSCVSCHKDGKGEGGLRLDLKAEFLKGGENGKVVEPGAPDKSSLYKLTVLPKEHDDVMPPKGEVLSPWQTDVLKQWIAEGANWPDSAGELKQTQRVSFAKDIQPIFEFNCVACHREGHDKGDLRMDTRELTFKGGGGGAGVVPFDPSGSSVYKSTTLPEDHDDLMPPKNKGGPLPKDKIELIRAWIEQGAVWPAGLVLTPKKAEEAAPDELTISKQIHERIVAAGGPATEAEMKNYTTTIPGTSVSYEMIPIKGGEYTLGSPASEAKRKADEGPQLKAKIAPFWMGKCEVTWNEYELFMYPEDKVAQLGDKADKVVDATSRPTKPYVEMSFGMGKDGFPAISMTQHAANKYCQWLSAKTGQFYRLPTEAEWEYACRAGTTTAYSWGDDASVMKEYAWFVNNSDFKYQKVGKKKPNPWGLYDMHGNVAEWCLDQYEPSYEALKAVLNSDGWVKQTAPYPHVVRGGSWDDDPEKLRSAARRGSDKSWKQQDPQLPKSIWYHTDAQFLGFRVVRPLKTPSAEEMNRYWNNGFPNDP
jgi:formylglycine-generating enzyme required for sulfatase activity/mono/diheme cytochrome c family protein